MQPAPSAPLEMVEPQLLFQSLMRLLVNPACFDGSSHAAQAGVGQQIAKIVLLLAAGRKASAKLPIPRYSVFLEHANGFSQICAISSPSANKL